MNECKELLSGGNAAVETFGASSRTGGGTTINVWLVDDSATYRTLLADLLSLEADLECHRHFPSAEAVLEALAREPPPAVILLDVRMPGMGGLEAIRPIKSLAPSTRVIMLTTFYDSYARAQALRDGASNLLLKIFPLEEIARHIRGIAEPGEDNSDATLSSRPERPEPEQGSRRWRGLEETAPIPATASRSALGGSVSSCPARGVGFFFSALRKWFAHFRQPVRPDSLRGAVLHQHPGDSVA